MKKRLDTYTVLCVYSTMNKERKEMKKKMTKNTKMKPYTPEQLAYFQAQEDMNDGVEDVMSVDYVDYLLGDVHNPTQGTTMTTEFNDLDGESDWFMD